MFGSDSEEEESKPSKSKKTKKGEQRAKQGRSSKAWIQEGADDEPVDFLDTKVVQRITGKFLVLKFILRKYAAVIVTFENVPMVHLKPGMIGESWN